VSSPPRLGAGGPGRYRSSLTAAPYPETANAASGHPETANAARRRRTGSRAARPNWVRERPCYMRVP
jgi:hypothetical protein